MASETLIPIAGVFNVIGSRANLQDSANPNVDAETGIFTWSAADIPEVRTKVLKNDGVGGQIKIQGLGVTDIVWGDFSRAVVPLEFEPLPIESFLIPAWPFITEVIALEPEFIDELIVRDAYPYVTIDYALSDFNVEIIDIEYIDAGNPNLVIDLEFQPLPELTAVVGSAFILIPLGCLEPPPEYWG